MSTDTSTWRSRIVDTGTTDPGELIANPANWRQHPRHQADALRDLLGQVGWVQGVVVNRTTGNLVDGHLRAELAVADGAEQIPVVWVELTEDEERLTLAALDPLGALAVANPEALHALLATVSPDGDALQGLLDDLGGQLDFDLPASDGPSAEDRDFWPTIRLQVSEETLRAFGEWWATVDGDDDNAKLTNVMDIIG